MRTPRLKVVSNNLSSAQRWIDPIGTLMLLHDQAAVWERIQKACFEKDRITFVDYCVLKKISPQAWLFEHLVPSWQHCLGKFRRQHLAGDSKSLEGVLSVVSSHLQFTLFTSPLQLGVWALSFLLRPPCLLVAAIHPHHDRLIPWKENK